MSIAIRGYSERGILNSLLYEIRYRADGLPSLIELLKLMSLPNARPQPNWEGIHHAQVIVEQSFSDFGDLDALILLDGPVQQAVFIEAKVKTAQRTAWLIQDEWARFGKHLARTDDADRSSSNLFVQLYRKQKLVCHVRGENCESDKVANHWRIGTNPVVLRAKEELAKYCQDSSPVWFVGIVPDTAENMEQFFSSVVGSYQNDRLSAWNPKLLGHLSWERLEQWVKTRPEQFADTLRCFAFNREQIYVAGAASSSTFRAGTTVTYAGGQGTPCLATVVRSGRENTRIRLADGDTLKVPTRELYTQS